MSDKITNLRELKEEIAKNIAQNMGWVYSKLLHEISEGTLEIDGITNLGENRYQITTYGEIGGERYTYDGVLPDYVRSGVYVRVLYTFDPPVIYEFRGLTEAPGSPFIRSLFLLVVIAVKTIMIRILLDYLGIFDDEELQHLEKRELLRRVLGDK